MASLSSWMEEHPKEVPTGYVAPNGDFYYAAYLEHWYMADEICNWFGYDSKNDPQGVLEEKGWVHITISVLGEHNTKIFFKDHLTEMQKITLRPLVENPPLYFSKLDAKWILKKEFPDVNFEWRE